MRAAALICCMTSGGLPALAGHAPAKSLCRVKERPAGAAGNPFPRTGGHRLVRRSAGRCPRTQIGSSPPGAAPGAAGLPVPPSLLPPALAHPRSPPLRRCPLGAFFDPPFFQRPTINARCTNVAACAAARLPLRGRGKAERPRPLPSRSRAPNRSPASARDRRPAAGPAKCAAPIGHLFSIRPAH